MRRKTAALQMCGGACGAGSQAHRFHRTGTRAGPGTELSEQPIFSRIFPSSGSDLPTVVPYLPLSCTVTAPSSSPP